MPFLKDDVEDILSQVAPNYYNQNELLQARELSRAHNVPFIKRKDISSRSFFKKAMPKFIKVRRMHIKVNFGLKIAINRFCQGKFTRLLKKIKKLQSLNSEEPIDILILSEKVSFDMIRCSQDLMDMLDNIVRQEESRLLRGDRESNHILIHVIRENVFEPEYPSRKITLKIKHLQAQFKEYSSEIDQIKDWSNQRKEMVKLEQTKNGSITLNLQTPYNEDLKDDFGFSRQQTFLCKTKNGQSDIFQMVSSARDEQEQQMRNQDALKLFL